MNILKLNKIGDQGFCRQCGATWDKYSGEECDCDDDL